MDRCFPERWVSVPAYGAAHGEPEFDLQQIS